MPLVPSAPFTPSRLGNPETHRLYPIYKSGNYSDFEFTAGENRFPVHKCILSSASEYFAKRFDKIWTDQSSTSLDELLPKPVPVECVHAFLGFLYTELISPDVLHKNLRELYQLSDYFRVLSLKEVVVKQLGYILTVDSAESYREWIRENIADVELAEVFVTFVFKNLSSLVQKEFKFHKLGKYMTRALLIKCASGQTNPSTQFFFESSDEEEVSNDEVDEI